MRRRAGLLLLVMVLLFLSAGAAGGDEVRFGVIADVHAHDIDSPLEGKWMTNTEERLTAFTESMNAWGADFVIELGDFINGWAVFGADPGAPDRIPDILTWSDGVYAAFVGPRYHVIGNHDLYNLDKPSYLEILGMNATYYSFDVGGFHFVVLDVQFAEDGTDLAHTYTGVAGFVPPTEISWLKEDLAASDRPTVVFVHQMLDDYIEEWGRALVANQNEIQRILAEDGDVIAVFQGHAHRNIHHEISGIHYITLEALVDQGTEASWASVVLDPVARRIGIAGTGDQASYELSYTGPE